MTWDASARVNNLFAASARDCTPAPARHIARVLFAPVSDDLEAVSCCASVLSDAEKRWAQSLLWEGGEAHFKQQRAFRRYCGAVAVELGAALIAHRFRGNGERLSLPALPARAAGLLVQLFLLQSGIPRGMVFYTAHRCRHRRPDETPRGDRARASVFFRSRGKGRRKRRRTDPHANLLPTLDPQGSSPKVHWRGLALRPRRVPIRAWPEHPHRRCATSVRWAGAI